MSIPLAVSPSVLTPGLYLSVNLLAGTASPGTGTLRTVIIAPKASTGDLTVDTEVRAGGGSDSAATAFGTGSPGHLAAKRIYDEFPQAQVDFVAPTAGTGTSTLDVTLAGSPTSDNVIDCNVMGRDFEVAWLNGGTANDARDDVIDAINARSEDLAVSAVSGGAGIITINSKVAGNIGDDVVCTFTLREGTTGTETINASTTVTSNLSGGATDPDLTSALSALEGEEYHYMCLCLSNTDAGNIASTNNIKRTYTHIDSLNTGLGAKLQQFVVGYTDQLAGAIASTPSSNSCNNAEFGQFVFCIDGLSLPCEFAAAEVGGRLAAVALDPASNRIGNVLSGVYGAKDKIGDKPTSAELESAIGTGVSIVSYDASGNPVTVRPVTTHSQTAVGGPDRRLLDLQNVDAAYIVARDVRDNLPLQFPNAKIAEDAADSEQPPQAGVTEMRDIKGWLISRLRFWDVQGVVDRASLDDIIDNDEIIVQINPSDATQVDIVLPFEIVQPLAKLGVVAQRRPS